MALRHRLRRGEGEHLRYSLDDIAAQIEQLSFMGSQYLIGGGRVGQYRQEEVRITSEDRAYAESGVAFAVVGRRVDLFSQVRFAWRRPGASARPMASDLFEDDALAPLTAPADLLSWMELDQALAGNSFVVRDGDTLRRLVPWWVAVVLTSERYPEHPENAWDAKVAGYLYQPSGAEAEVFLEHEVAHYYNRPDPSARYRGMSYLRPALRNIGNTEAAERYISQFWRNSATPSVYMKFPESKTPAEVEQFADIYEGRHQGLANALKTAYIGGGADPMVLGSKLSDLASRDISAREFGIVCAAAGVPPVVVSMVPGLEATATFNNYAAALRSFADLTIRPCWTKATAALAKLVGSPMRGAEGVLHADPTGIAALQEDAKDDAEVAEAEARTMRTLIEAGYDPDSVTLAITTGDRSKLVHTGLVSVQLQAPGGANLDGGAPEAEPTGDGEPLQRSVHDGAQVLMSTYLPVREGLLDVDEARAMANRAGAGLVGPAPVRAQPVAQPELDATADERAELNDEQGAPPEEEVAA